MKYSLKLRLVVLSNNYQAEALQVKRVNPWMTYMYPLHRIREFGHSPKCMDSISERTLTSTEMRDTCTYLLGYDVVDGLLEDPSSNWSEFIQSLKVSITEYNDDDSSKGLQISNNNTRPLIDIRLLTEAYQPVAVKRTNRCTNCCFKNLWSLFMK